jgi:REP element-mobilizing transposase RayT
MVRPLRLEFPGAVYHVISRGNERGPIFLDESDRTDFLSYLGIAVRKEAFLLHAYCLMGNHYHLLLETPEGKLSRGMHWLNGQYAQRFNARHERCGHLFEGRFKAVIIEKESHLLELQRYIVLNPVRACFVERPELWKWSNYRATCGQASRPTWLEVSWTLRQFGEPAAEARRAYIEFVEAAIGMSSVARRARNEFYLGGNEFLKEIAALIGSRSCDEEIPAVQRTPIALDLSTIEALVAHEWNVSPGELRRFRGGPAKIAAIYLARKLTTLPAREVGAWFGVGRGRVANVIAEVDRGRHGDMRIHLSRLMDLLRDEGRKTVKKTGHKCQVET